MRNYIIKRLLLSVVILFFVCFIIYVLMRCLPASYVENMAMQLSQKPGSKTYDEWLAQLNAQYHLDMHLIPGYFMQLWEMLRGNFGDSWKFTAPVIDVFAGCIGVSFVMGAISLVLQLIIAIPLGIIAATKQYSKADYAISVFALAGISLPTFFFATLLKLVFSVKLGWFDLVGLTGRDFYQLDAFGQFLDMAHHLVLPVITLTVISVGSLMRYTRTNMLEVLNADYIRTARAKGLRERAVIWRHALKNALMPIITVIGSNFGSLLGGAVVIETVFSLPGLGSLIVTSIRSKDVPQVMAGTLFIALIFCLVLLVVDVAYAFIDPRIRTRYIKEKKDRRPKQESEVQAV